MSDQGGLASSPAYSVPALDKALDILELLAGASEPMTQTAIADAVGRNVSQIYRVLATLERRGYLFREPASGLYGLSMALFDLAHRHPPLRGLVQAAAGPMRRLADEVRQSCNLGVVDGGAVRILAQAESPADFGFRVRVGALFPIGSTAVGTLLSYAGRGVGQRPARRADVAAAGDGAEAGQLDAGYLTRVDGTQARHHRRRRGRLRSRGRHDRRAHRSLREHLVQRRAARGRRGGRPRSGRRDHAAAGRRGARDRRVTSAAASSAAASVSP